MRRDRENQAEPGCLRTHGPDMDPVRLSPYRPAALARPHREAGHTTAPDRKSPTMPKKLLASKEASTHGSGATACTHLVSPCIRHARRSDYTALHAPLVAPAPEPGPIPDSRHRRSRWRASSTAETAARTEAGPRIGVRGDGWRRAFPSHRTEMCACGRARGPGRRWEWLRHRFRSTTAGIPSGLPGK